MAKQSVMSVPQQSADAPRKPDLSRVEVMARDIFRDLYCQSRGAMQMDHMALKAIEAATAFYDVWDHQQTPHE
jgi:hypothetical protein